MGGVNMIEEFQGKYRWLSNFWLVAIEYQGRIYQSVEHAYQSAKFEGLTPIQEEIQNSSSPGEAKRIGKKYKNFVRTDWVEVNLQIMEELVRKKFSNPSLRKMLLETGNQLIQEGNWWHDEFWGYSFHSGKGLNHLGKIIMKVRDEIRKEG
jgi:hypothetical protein